jgi:hypothetical protein
MSAAWPLQVALDTALSGDAPLTAIITGVFSEGVVPEGQPYPYITLGESGEGRNRKFGTRGYNNAETLHIWCDKLGKQQCLQVYDHINRILDGNLLPMPAGYAMVLATCELVTMFRDPDGPMHAVVAYNAHIDGA